MLTFVPTPLGNLEDITFRALRTLEKATIVFCEDTRVAKHLIQALKQRFAFDPVPKRYISMHSHNEKQVIDRLDSDLFEEEAVYLSDAGMPAISDPGALLVRWCQRNGVPYTVLPGPTAMATAYAASGFAQTKFLFFGFLPHKGAARDEALREAMSQPYATILYEAPHRLLKLLSQIEALDPQRVLFAAKEISKRHERYFKGTASELMAQIDETTKKGEWVVILDGARNMKESVDLSSLRGLDLPPKQLAKVMAGATGRSVKECYEEILADKGSK